MDDWSRVLGRAEYKVEGDRLHALIDAVLSSFPSEVSPLRSLVEIRIRKRATRGTVGLTTYRLNGPSGTREVEPGTQTITFYSGLLDQLSDEAAKGVVVHEIAHAWLNEHVSPLHSEEREVEADELARAWGYGGYLGALEAETDPY